MKVALCRTCIAYQPDSDGQGNGVCSVSGCSVCECLAGCIDWRYFRVWEQRPKNIFLKK